MSKGRQLPRFEFEDNDVKILIELKGVEKLTKNRYERALITLITYMSAFRGAVLTEEENKLMDAVEKFTCEQVTNIQIQQIVRHVEGRPRG